MADKLNSDGFLIETVEQESTEDMQTEFSDLTENDEDNLLSEVTNDLEDDIPRARVQRQKSTTSREHGTKLPKEKPSTSSHQRNNLGRKRHQKNKSTRGGSRGGVEGVATPPLSSILIFFNSSLKKIRTKLSFTKLFHFHHSPAFADLKR